MSDVDTQGYTEDDILPITPAASWADLVRWESTPFRPSDDITLLSYGFHFASNGTDMYRDGADGNWYVDLSRAIPIWYLNGSRVGPKTYDEVANYFSKERKRA
jgi:hypothetical protein